MTGIQVLYALLLILSPTVTIFFNSYFTQRGKNLADKNDIKDLTKIVESVKKEFIEENEKLKATLSHLVGRQNLMFLEGKTSLVEFLSSMDIWNNNLTNNEVYKFGKGDRKKIEALQKLFQKNEEQASYQLLKLDLLVYDIEIMNTTNRYYQIIKNFHTELTKDLIALDACIINEESPSYYEETSEGNFKENYQDLDEIEKMKVIIRDKIQREKENFKEDLFQIRSDFTQAARNYLLFKTS